MYKADLNHPVNPAQDGNAVHPARLATGQTLPQGGSGEQNWDNRGSQDRTVTGRIGPRRSGLVGREKTVEPPQPGRVIDKRRPSLGASWSCCSKEHGRIGCSSVSPSCRGDAPSCNGSARKSLALPIFEPCEGKLSRTVLRGAWARQPAAPTRRSGSLHLNRQTPTRIENLRRVKNSKSRLNPPATLIQRQPQNHRAHLKIRHQFPGGSAYRTHNENSSWVNCGGILKR